VFADGIVFVVAADHPLAARPARSADDLPSSPLTPSTGTPEPEQRWFVANGLAGRPPMRDRLTFPLTEAIVDAARAGLGIAPMSEWIASPYLDHHVVAKRMKRPLRRPWRIAFHPEAADHARRLAAALVGLAPRIYA
jgi:LysR family transcriptional regulator for metE and metH